ncbi:MAG: metallophosphoesterase [Candidatus Eisenbacteria bacterium]
MQCLFVSDLHGHVGRYEKLFEAVSSERPAALFLGGDLLPMRGVAWQPDGSSYDSFLESFLIPRFDDLRSAMGSDYPAVFVILGNDDLRAEEDKVLEGEAQGTWTYVHGRRAELNGYSVYGYACVPPTPFMLKDWERYDVSRFVDPGGVTPEAGRRSVTHDEHEVRYGTILRDLEELVGDADLRSAVFLFHSPPYRTMLDRAALDGRKVDHVPLDVHVGSIAMRRFIEARQPRITLHGHVHESVSITGEWHDRIGRTHLFGAGHDGPELAVVRFDPGEPEKASRELL